MRACQTGCMFFGLLIEILYSKNVVVVNIYKCNNYLLSAVLIRLFYVTFFLMSFEFVTIVHIFVFLFVFHYVVVLVR